VGGEEGGGGGGRGGGGKGEEGLTKNTDRVSVDARDGLKDERDVFESGLLGAEGRAGGREGGKEESHDRIGSIPPALPPSLRSYLGERAT